MSAEALTKKTRAGHKASATRTVRQIDEVVAAEEPDKARLALLQMTLKELETIKNLDAEIVDLIDDETILTEEIEQADGYKETLFSALLKADKLLKDPPTTPPTSVAAAPPTTTATPSAKPNSVRLPKLHLRHFNGDLTKWRNHLKRQSTAIQICQASKNSITCPSYWRIQLERRLLASPSRKRTTPKLYLLSRRDLEEHNR